MIPYIDLEGRLSTSDLISNSNSPAFVDKDSNVFIVGPGYISVSIKGSKTLDTVKIPMDPSCLFFAEYLNNSVTILDLPSGGNLKAGDRDLLGIKRFISRLIDFGAKYCSVKYVIGDVFKDIPNEKYDLIYDHNTWEWSTRPTENRQANLTRLFAIYSQHLSNNGKVLMTFDNPENIKVILRCLPKGFKASYLGNFRDSYHVNDNVVTSIYHEIWSSTDVIDEQNNLIPFYKMNYMIVLEKTN